MTAPRAETGLALILLLLLAWLVLAPAGAVLASGADRNALARVLSSTAILLNTLGIAAGATMLSLAIGAVLALLLVRLDTPGRGVLEALVQVPLFVTPLLTAMAWSWLGSPKSGLLNLVAQRVVGVSVLDLHGAGGVVFVAGLSYAPLPFLLVSGALRAMDPALEDGARIHGATTGYALRAVTLKLVRPAATGAAILVFVQAMGLFSIPAILGMPSGLAVAGTEIYRLLNTYPPRLAQAASWGLLLLVLTAGLVWAQSALLARRSYVTVSGKSFRPRLIRLRRLRWPAAAFVWLYLALALGLPVLTLLWAASVDFITADPALMHFSLRHFQYVLFTYTKTGLATWNSLVLALASACLVALLGLAIGWIAVRRAGTLARSIEQLAMVPLAIPPIVLAIGVLNTYAGLQVLPLYGTAGVLLVAYVAHYLPIGARAMSGAVRQLHPELEDAGRAAGASLAYTLRRIVLPLTRPTLAATWTLVFVLALQEVSASILLYTSRSTVLSVAMFDLWEAGNVGAVAALGTLQLGLTAVVLAVLVFMRRREVAQ